jgi:hypothetical protein
LRGYATAHPEYRFVALLGNAQRINRRSSPDKVMGTGTGLCKRQSRIEIKAAPLTANRRFAPPLS